MRIKRGSSGNPWLRTLVEDPAGNAHYQGVEKIINGICWTIGLNTLRKSWLPSFSSLPLGGRHRGEQGDSDPVMFAIVKTGGKQYRVALGDQIVVERLEGDVGAEISLDQVLAIGDGDSGAIGRPTLADASVRARIIQQPRGTKVIVFKKKKRKNYRRKHGHRQELTVLRIEEIRRATGIRHEVDEGAAGEDPPAAPTDSEV